MLQMYAANSSVDIMEMELMPNHVPTRMEVDPPFGIHKAIKVIKRISIKSFEKGISITENKNAITMDNSYVVSTVVGAPLAVRKQYIKNQNTSQRQRDRLG